MNSAALHLQTGFTQPQPCQEAGGEPRQVVESLSLGTFKTDLDVFLCILPWVILLWLDYLWRTLPTATTLCFCDCMVNGGAGIVNLE